MFLSLAFGIYLNNPEHVSSLSFMVYLICSCSFSAKSTLSDSHWKFPRCTPFSQERPSPERFLLLEDFLSSIFPFLQQLIKVYMISFMSSVQPLFRSPERSTLSLPVTGSCGNWTFLILSSPSPTLWPALEPAGCHGSSVATKGFAQRGLTLGIWCAVVVGLPSRNNSTFARAFAMKSCRWWWCVQWAFAPAFYMMSCRWRWCVWWRFALLPNH